MEKRQSGRITHTKNFNNKRSGSSISDVLILGDNKRQVASFAGEIIDGHHFDLPSK